MSPHREQAQGLIDFIHRSPTAFHATHVMSEKLEAAGFRLLDERSPWHLNPGDRCYVTRNDSSLIAFVVGEAPPEEEGFCIVGAHTDSPSFRIKPMPSITRHGVRQLGVEPYGGLLLSTWMDRDLSIAGRVLVHQQKSSTPKAYLINFDRPLLRIPNLAIHLDREVNTKGLVLNQQQHMIPILGLETDVPADPNAFLTLLAAEVQRVHSVDLGPAEILDFDLYLYDTQKGALGGIDEEFIYSARLDNLASCHAALLSLLRSWDTAPVTKPTRVVAFWDNEECGSRSMQGAQGPFIRQVFERVVESRSPQAEQAMNRAIASSFLISTDMAHAVHPNYADRHEPSHMPRLGKGPVIKFNANQSYATDGMSAARFVAICRNAGFEPQRFVMRSDLPCGSTIGPITAALTGIKTVDVGNPMLSMHSIREMGAVEDHYLMMAALSGYFGEAKSEAGAQAVQQGRVVRLV